MDLKKGTILINYTGRRGGGALDSYETAKAFAEIGIPVIAVVSDQVENIKAWRELPLEKLIEIPTYRNKKEFLTGSLFFRKKQGRIIRKACDGYEITHIICPMYALWMPKVDRLFPKARVALVLHDVSAHSGEESLSFLNKSIYRSADFYFVHSRRYVEEAKRKYKKPVHYVPLARHNFYKTIPNKKRIIKYSSDKIHFVFFGRISEYKGLDTLAEAYQMVRGRNPELVCDLTVVGNGDFRKYREMYDALPDTTVINRWIKDEEVESVFMGENLICICPYKDATQSGVVLLSMDYGVPVIASRSGGIEEQVRDEENGLLFAPGNAEELSKVMERLASDAELRKKLSDQGKKNMEELTWEHTAMEMIHCLRIGFEARAL